MAFPSCLAYINQIVLAVFDNTDRSRQFRGTILISPEGRRKVAYFPSFAIS